MLYNLKRCYTATIGTGTLTIGAAILNDFSDIPDGTTVSYSIMQGSLSAGFDAEVGRGTYSAGTLARDTVLSSTSGGAKIALDGTAQVVVTALAEDFVSFSDGVAGQVAAWSSTDGITAGALIPPASNILTLTNAAASTLALNIGSGKALTLTAADNYTLTVPATGTAALLETANVFTTTQTITPATDVVGLVVNKSTSANAIQIKNGATVLSAVTKDGHIAVDIQAYSAGRIYVGANSVNAMLQGVRTITASANVYGIYIAQTTDNSSANVVYGARFLVQGGASSGTQSGEMIGADYTAQITGNQNTTTVWGANIVVSQKGSGTLANAIGVNLSVSKTAGTVTLAKALNINDVSAATTNYAIYTGLGLVRLGDSLSVTMAADRVPFSVTGHTTQTNPSIFIDNTATTNAVRNVLKLETQSTGTAANGLGAGLLFTIETATAGTIQNAGRVYTVTVDATNASRKYALVGTAFDTAEREGWRVEADGSAAKIGLYGAATVARATTAGTASTFAANTSGIVDDTATFDNYTIGQVVKALRDIGILT